MATPTDLHPDASSARDDLIARLALFMDDSVAPDERSAAAAELARSAEGRRLLEAWQTLDSPPPAAPSRDLVAAVMRQLPAQPVHAPRHDEPRAGLAGWARGIEQLLARPRLRYVLAFAGLLAVALLFVTSQPAVAPGEVSGAAVGGADRAWMVVVVAGAAALAGLWLWRRRS